MQAEKQDEQWKEAVEQLDHLPPGISFHAGNTWKRLEHQLQPATTPSIIKGNPFYYAAACLVVAAVSAAVWLSRPAVKAPIAARPVINTPPVIHQAAMAPAKDIAIIPVKKEKMSHEIRATDTAAQAQVYAVADTITTAPVIIPANPVNDIAAQVKNITGTKTKAVKKFVVVHINDLANNTPEIPVTIPESRRMVQQTEEIDNTTPPEAPKSRWLSRPKVVTTVSLTENP